MDVWSSFFLVIWKNWNGQDTKIFLSLCTEYSEMDSLLQTELNDIPQARLYHFSRPFFMIFWKKYAKIKKKSHKNLCILTVSFFSKLSKKLNFKHPKLIFKNVPPRLTLFGPILLLISKCWQNNGVPTLLTSHLRSLWCDFSIFSILANYNKQRKKQEIACR